MDQQTETSVFFLSFFFYNLTEFKKKLCTEKTISAKD